MVAIGLGDDELEADIEESTPLPPSPGNFVSIEAIPGDPEILIRVSEYDHRIIEKHNDTSTKSTPEILYSEAQWLDITKRCEHATAEALRMRDVAHRQKYDFDEHSFSPPPIEPRSGDMTPVKSNLNNTTNDSNMTEPVIRTQRVHRSRRIATPESVLNVIKQNCVYRGSERRRQLDNIYVQLEQTGLLTLLLGQRQQPILNSLEDTGYTREKIIVKPGNPYIENSLSSTTIDTVQQDTYITIPEDDIFQYNYDKSRLMAIVTTMFHASYSTYGEEAKKNGDPVHYYNCLMSHVFGTKTKDINSTWEDIINFKINRSVVFAVECVRWERLFENAKYAHGKPVEEFQKMAFLNKHVYNDMRIGWHSTMANAKINKFNYDQCVQALYEATDDVLEKDQTIRVCTVSANSSQPSQKTKSVNYCRNYQTNSCNRSNCRYLHERDPNFNFQSIPDGPRTDSSLPQHVSTVNRKSQPSNNFNNRKPDNRDNRKPDNRDNRKPDNRDNRKPSSSAAPSASSQQSNSQSESQPKQSSAKLNRVEAERQDFQSWSDTSQKGYRNQSYNALRFRKRKLDQEERLKEIEWPTHAERLLSHQSDISELPEDYDSKLPRLTSFATGDVNSLENASRSSNESRHAEPLVHSLPRRTHEPAVVITEQPQVSYLHDIDGSYSDFNMRELTTIMTNFASKASNKQFYNRYLVSALFNIEAYYSKPEMEPHVRTYNPDLKDVSISPDTFMYQCHDEQDTTIVTNKLRLFNYNENQPYFNKHLRKDVVNNTRPWYTCIIQAACIAFGGIANIQYDLTKSVKYNMYDPSNHHYNHSRDYGHYWSQQAHVTDYICLTNDICSMRCTFGEASNQMLIDTLLCALVYDFMAFVSQFIGYDRCYDIARVATLRDILVEEVNTCSNTSPFAVHEMHTVFHYIIQNTTPVYDAYRHMHIQTRYLMKLNRVHNPDLIQPSQLNAHSNARSCKQTYIRYFHTSHRLNAISRSRNRIIIDTGASLCATSDSTILQNIRPCNDMVAYPAFGKKIVPKLRGEYGDLQLEALIIPSMPDTLISVSQLCYGGTTNKQNIAVFTTEGVRVFEFDTVREALKIMDKDGVEILRGYESDGIYVTDKNKYVDYKSQTLFLAQFKPTSLFDHLHQVTGHSGVKGMQWHRENSLNAKYSNSDENKRRGICQGCVYGSLAPTNTDQYRQHREIPLIPGQCFSLDAYTHTRVSSRGRLYCDLFTDLATRRVYPVFTKDRSAQELCEQARMLFLQNPDWHTNASREQARFIRLDSESNYRSVEFLAFTSSIGYNLERTPVRDKHAGGVAERTVGLISAKTNIAMMSPTPRTPQSYWDYAMAYACDTQSFNYSSVIGTSPYMKITGQPVNIKYLQPFWSSCYVFIPREERNKVGSPRAYKAHFVGYANTKLLFPNYVVIPVTDTGHYLKHKDSKNVIFDPTINFSVYTEDEEPFDREFDNTDHYVPFLQRTNAPIILQGPDATPNINTENETHVPISPERIIFEDAKKKSLTSVLEEEQKETEENLNEYHPPYEEEDGTPVYWYHYYVRNTEYPLIMCETQNFNKMKIGNNPNVPQNYYKAMRYPEWREAIDKELTKFEKNLCLEIVPYNKQHLVPMMWTFVIKSDGTKKARLVGRGDLMLPYVDFDPYAVYCGNVTASSIKICITIAAKYKLFMKGGDLEGAYLVTRANPNYPVYIKTPQGYSVPKGMCIQAVGNLYGFPPAGQNFSIEFDKCVAECGYVNTPWDLKLFYKWKNNKPILLMVHSDDFRWFGDKDDLSEWQLLVTTFEKHKYKVSDATEKEFVGIRITRDEHYNYFLDQTRMIDDIMNEAHMKNEKDEKLPYPNPTMGPALSKLDNATDENAEDCRKFPYRRVIGQLMYGMVHTLVTIMYPLNVLSRYGNNPGPRHIQFAKHLLRYVRTIKMDRLRFNTHDGPTDIKTMTGELQLYFQCDADLAGNLDNKHSQTSYLGYLGGSLICWCSTDQGSISTSTAESEVKAVNHTLKCEVIANRGILTTMGWKQDPTVIQEDNKACIDASVVQHMTKRMRHLALTENFLKEKFADGTCILKKVESKNNNADIGTKRLQFPLFDYLSFPLTDRTLRETKKNKK
jgi:hypothetical protein